jgi:hypothetical protein
MIEEPFNLMKSLQQAKKAGLIDSDLTITCPNCKAIFPKEYGNCPQCQTDQSFTATDFKITVLWE